MARKLIYILFSLLFAFNVYASVELDSDANGATDIDKGGTNSQDGSIISVKQSGIPGIVKLYTADALVEFGSGFIGPDTANDNTLFKLPSTDGTVGQQWAFSAPVTEVIDSVSYEIVTISWVDNGSGGGASITEVADTPEGWEMTPGDLYIAQDDGELSFLLADSSEVFRYSATSSTALFDLSLEVSETDGSTLDINGTSYGNGTYSILGLSGATAMAASFITADTATFTGTDSGDVTGTSPNFSINMTADKSLICTFSQAVTEACIGWDEPSCTPSTVPTSSFATGTTTAGRIWTADVAKTAISLNAYKTGSSTGELVLYRVVGTTGTLLGRASYAVPSAGFTGYLTLIPESGQTLDYEIGDELFIADSYTAQTGYLGREDTGGDGMYIATPGGSPSASTVDVGTPSSGRDMAISMKSE